LATFADRENIILSQWHFTKAPLLQRTMATVIAKCSLLTRDDEVTAWNGSWIAAD